MAEAGGPVFEGSSAQPEMVKSGIVERMKAKWAARVEASKKLNEAQMRKKAEFKQIGPNLEQAYIESYQKIINALGEGKLKKVGEKMLPLIKVQAKIARVAAAVPDIFFGSQFTYSGINDSISGYRQALLNPRALFRDVVGSLVVGHAETAIGGAILWQAPTRKIATRMIEFGGNMGEKTVSAITNKIIGRKAEAMPAS